MKKEVEYLTLSRSNAHLKQFLLNVISDRYGYSILD